MLITLKDACIHKYKSIEFDQSFELDEKITALVGMNESGKTTVLESLAKTNYFESDDSFKFNTTHDYPRKEKKSLDKSKENPKAVTATFQISDALIEEINDELGASVFTQTSFSRIVKYDNSVTISGIKADHKAFWDAQLDTSTIIDEAIKTQLKSSRTRVSVMKVIGSIGANEDTEETIDYLNDLLDYFPENKSWDSDLDGYIYTKWISPHTPKFLYYDEYYALPSRISIEGLQNDQLEDEEQKTAKALFELADINVDEILDSDDFENFIAELEATEASISEDLFEYWGSNSNLEIQFKIDKKHITRGNNTSIVEHILDIRVRNNRTKVSLPLKNRSKGFNWFFSFLVWFKKIQEDKNSSYILLLDEPGLNLHTTAQENLLDFIESLSENYQVVYTTHSPFMVNSEKLHRVRTVLETEKGSVISDSIQEKDPNTLFPLQAALGYNIAQNLFISNNNLLVEGVSDLVYLQVMDAILKEKGGEGLDEDITIVPVGGLDKVATFVSLLRGSKLKIACLLDSNIDNSNKEKIDSLIQQKIIQKNRIKFFDEYIDGLKSADIEDVFSKEDYLRLFNKAFPDLPNIKDGEIKGKDRQIIPQINNHLKINRFNHYSPANALAKSGATYTSFDKITINQFEAIFESVNLMFEKK